MLSTLLYSISPDVLRPPSSLAVILSFIWSRIIIYHEVNAWDSVGNIYYTNNSQSSVGFAPGIKCLIRQKCRRKDVPQEGWIISPNDLLQWYKIIRLKINPIMPTKALRFHSKNSTRILCFVALYVVIDIVNAEWLFLGEKEVIVLIVSLVAIFSKT